MAAALVVRPYRPVTAASCRPCLSVPHPSTFARSFTFARHCRLPTTSFLNCDSCRNLKRGAGGSLSVHGDRGEKRVKGKCTRPSRTTASVERTDKKKTQSGSKESSSDSEEGEAWQINGTTGGLPVQIFEPPKFFNLASAIACGLAVLTSVEIGSYILKRVESIPILAGAETLIGLMVSVRFTMKYLIGGAGRARLESLFEGVLDKILGSKLMEDGRASGPSMLEVQLRSVVDRHLPPVRLEGGRVNEKVAVSNSSKQSLITALLNFISEREHKARRINAVLREDVETVEREKAQLKQQMQDKISGSPIAEIARLTELRDTLKGERDEARSQVVSLTSRVEALTVQLQTTSAAFQHADSLTYELKQELETLLDEKNRLREKVARLESKEAEAMAALETARKVQTEKMTRVEEDARLQKQLASTELGEAKAKICALEEAAAAAASELSAVQRMQVDAMESKEKELESQKETAAQELQCALDQLRLLEAREREVTATLEAARAEHADVCREKEREMVRYRSEVALELDNLKEMVKVKEAAEAQAVAALEVARAQHRGQMEERQTEHDEQREMAMAELAAAEKRVTMLEMREADMAAALESVQNGRAEAMAALESKFQQRIEEMDKALSAAVERVSMSERSEKDADVALQDARKRLEAQLVEREEELQREMKGLLEELKETVERVVDLEKAATEATSLLEDAKARHAKEMEEKEREMRVLREQALLEVEATAERMEESLELLRSERQYFADAAQALETRMEEMLEEREEREVRIAKLEAALSSAQDAAKVTSENQVTEMLRNELERTKQEAESSERSAMAQICELSLKWKEAESRASLAEAKLIEKTAATENVMARASELVASGDGYGEAEALTSLLSEKVVEVARAKSGAAGTVTSGSSDLEKDDALRSVKAIASMTPEKLSELKSYARSVRLDFLDLALTAREQADDVDRFAKVLEERGAEYKWARSYIVQLLSYTRKKNKSR